MQHTVTKPAVATGASLTGALLAYAGRLWRVMQHRREVNRLLNVDDRMLADIGLTRSEVEGALETPLHVDPSMQLVRARQARRIAGRRRF